MRIPNWLKRFVFWSMLCLVGAPILLALTLVEVWGLLSDKYGECVYDLKDRRYAALSKTGDFVLWEEGISPISNFTDGLATYKETPPGSYSNFSGPFSGGFIEPNGRKHPLKMWWVHSTTQISNGLANVQDPYTRLFAFVDVSGRQKIATEFNAAAPFCEGLAAVSTERLGKNQKMPSMSGRWGYIDKIGNYVIPPRYAFAGNFSGGRAIVSPLAEPSSRYVIDKNGRVIFKCKFEEMGDFSKDGIAIFKNKGSFGLIDRDGNVTAKGLAFKSFSDGLGEIHSGDYIAFADKTGHVLLKTKFKRFYGSASTFSDGLASVAEGELCTDVSSKFHGYTPRLTFIDRTGQVHKFSIPNRIITEAYPFIEGHTIVKTAIAQIQPD